ncbi:MAG TPA: acyl-ACP--UDP-N-acetylglucosamine O-acyltransferase [Tepidisphaeraceae bacterium]|jgi:UDP-N-acetylglucosamine acyltransferase|nr:acyl-ACP--UDP-N-acetylglucosamine O-acyltransferase [Tepidisphaeraceae bacterium]
MREIHPTAIVDRQAELADDVKVGAYTIIKAGVIVGPGTVIQEHCHVHGNTTIGQRCKIGPAAFVGLPPQHSKYDGANARAVIGDDVVIRETASIHRSIIADAEHETRVGSRCMLMAGAHVGHDCDVREDVVLAHGSMLGGHCVVGSRAFIGGGATIHQFVRIGRLSIISGNEAISHDVPPFSAARYRGLKGYNAIGCKRAGFSRETIHALRAAFYCLHMNRTLPAAIEAIRQTVPMLPEIQELVEFFTTTRRGVLGSVKGKGITRLGQSDEVADDDQD